jgi:VanZ like family
MSRNQDTGCTAPGAGYDWSNRFLIAGAAGILFLTLYPFEFLSRPKMIEDVSPFLLGKGWKSSGALNIFLNILLFIPLGFALGTKFKRKGKSWKSVLLYTWLAGASLSYAIEFVQLYIPARDSGWEDVLTNSTGAAVGCIASLFLASWLFRVLSDWEKGLKVWLGPRRIAVILLVYFAAWFVVSIALQRKTQLNNWSTDCFLVIGNDATGRHPWKGEVWRLEIWDHALSKDVAEKLPRADLLVRFDFSVTPPSQDNAQLVIPFSLARNTTAQLPEDFKQAHERPWGASKAPVTELVNNLKRTNQFSIRVVLRPAGVGNPNGSIISISDPSGLSDLYLRQENADLVFRFRSPVCVRRPGLAWKISNLLATNRVRDILFSFDGSDTRLYVDGKKLQNYSMGPGTALASLFRRVKQAELNGYRDVYYAIVFFPAGGFLGIALTRPFWRQFALSSLLVFAALLAPFLLEWILMYTDGRSFSMNNLVLSASMAIMGILWMST